MSQQINLYNPLFLKQEKHFSARTLVQALGVVGFAIIGVYAFGLVQTRSAERVATQYREQLTSAQNQLTALTRQSAGRVRSKALESEVAQLEAQVKVRQQTLQALGAGELGNTAGFSEFLAALGRQAMSGVWLTRISIEDAGNGLAVEGRALRADLLPTYLGALSRESMMRGRRITEMKVTAAKAATGQTGPAKFVEFSLAAPLEVRESPASAGRTQ
jgi:Tfp pilus assembly protein PilN